MPVIEYLENFQAKWNSSILTLGVFDGLHRGHQSLIKEVEKQSHKGKFLKVLLTYHPHPDFILGKRKVQSGTELFTYDEKIYLLKNCPMDVVCFLNFTQKIANMTAMRYLKEILLGKLHATHIVLGYDQHFGRGRKGDYSLLKKMSKRYSFQVSQVKALKYRGEIISSSNIRKHILLGNIEKANALLGYNFFIQSVVQKGEKRGRLLGFPTANLKSYPTKVIPQEGVYAGWVFHKGKKYQSMISIGKNPSFHHENKDIRKKIEAHLLDFRGKLYDEIISLSFQKRIRDQISFRTPQELTAQLEKDRSLVQKLR